MGDRDDCAKPLAIRQLPFTVLASVALTQVDNSISRRAAMVDLTRHGAVLLCDKPMRKGTVHILVIPTNGAIVASLVRVEQHGPARVTAWASSMPTSTDLISPLCSALATSHAWRTIK